MEDAAERESREWVAIAAALLPQLSASPRSSRKAFLEEAAGTWHRSPQTLHRMCKALEYIRMHRERSGLTEAEVRSPVASVEVLARIERKHPGKAEELWLSTLMGRISFRELLARERALPKHTEVARDDANRRKMLWSRLAKDILPNGPSPSVFASNENKPSEFGKMLHVDWEVDVEGCGDVAIFLSPRIVFSAHRGRAVSDQFPLMLAATYFYNQTIFIAWNDVETAFVRRLCSKVKRDCDLRIETFSRLPTGRSIGNEFRV